MTNVDLLYLNVFLISRDMGAAIMVGLVTGLGILTYEYFSDRKATKEHREKHKRKRVHTENLEALHELKEKGILSEEELNKKIDILNDKMLNDYLMENEEYKKLNYLLKADLITADEFNEKIKIIKKRMESSTVPPYLKIDTDLLSDKGRNKAWTLYIKGLKKGNYHILVGLAEHLEKVFGIKNTTDAETFVNMVLTEYDRKRYQKK